MSFFNIITYFIIKIKRRQKAAGPIGLTGFPPFLFSFPLDGGTRSVTQMERYERLEFCQLQGIGVDCVPNEIRNMSQWWFENKIGLGSQVSGK